MVSNPNSRFLGPLNGRRQDMRRHKDHRESPAELFRVRLRDSGGGFLFVHAKEPRLCPLICPESSAPSMTSAQASGLTSSFSRALWTLLLVPSQEPCSGMEHAAGGVSDFLERTSTGVASRPGSLGWGTSGAARARPGRRCGLACCI